MILIAESPSRRTEYRRYLGNAGLGINSCSQEIYRSEVAAEFVLKLTRDTYHPRLTSEFPGYADIDAGARIAIYDNEYGYWRHEIGYICKTFEFLSIPRPQSVFAMGRNGYVQPGQPDSPRKDLTGLLRPNAKLWKFEGPGFAIDTGRFPWPPKDGSEVPREGPLTGSVELMMPDLPETQDATTIDVDLQISYTFVDRANIVLAAPQNLSISHSSPQPTKIDVKNGAQLLTFIFDGKSKRQYYDDRVIIGFVDQVVMDKVEREYQIDIRTYEIMKDEREGVVNLLFFVFSTLVVACFGIWGERFLKISSIKNF